MTVAETIVQHIEALPESIQAEVLDFVGYLESKKETGKSEKTNWSDFSLSQAMLGMETEDSLYSTEDLKEVFV